MPRISSTEWTDVIDSFNRAIQILTGEIYSSCLIKGIIPLSDLKQNLPISIEYKPEFTSSSCYKKVIDLFGTKDLIETEKKIL